MGGIFSGRWHAHQRRQTVEECWHLDIDAIMRYLNSDADSMETGFKTVLGYNAGSEFHVVLNVSLRSFKLLDEEFSGRLILTYAIEGEVVQTLIPLSTLVPHFGGVRYRMHCPSKSVAGSCYKPVFKLYLPIRKRYFLCRQCHDLTYRSVQEHDKRIDELLKNPHKLSSHIKMAVSSSKYPTRLFLILKALRKLPYESELRNSGINTAE